MHFCLNNSEETGIWKVVFYVMIVTLNMNVPSLEKVPKDELKSFKKSKLPLKLIIESINIQFVGFFCLHQELCI